MVPIRTVCGYCLAKGRAKSKAHDCDRDRKSGDLPLARGGPCAARGVPAPRRPQGGARDASWRLRSCGPASWGATALSGAKGSTGQPCVIAITPDYDSLHRALRDRREQLNIAFTTLDRAAYLTSGHASKILSPSRLKRATFETLDFLLPALGGTAAKWFTSLKGGRHASRCL
jgi:hypothetical protein